MFKQDRVWGPASTEPHENKPDDQLQAELDELWAQLARLRGRDTVLGGYSAERAALLDQAVARVKVKRARERAKEKAAKEEAKKPAPAFVRVEFEPNACVYAACQRSEEPYEVGPVWGASERSVKRALCMLTETCPCRARFHEEADPTGVGPSESA